MGAVIEFNQNMRRTGPQVGLNTLWRMGRGVRDAIIARTLAGKDPWEGVFPEYGRVERAAEVLMFKKGFRGRRRSTPRIGTSD